MSIRWVLVIAMLAVVSAACGPTGDPKIEVGDAQAGVPVGGASQVVLDIRNTGDGDDVLQRASTDHALSVEMHETTIADGRASMERLEQVEVPAAGQVSFRPGGLHLMLVVPEATVVDGATFDLTLEFERSGAMTVPVTVVDMLDLAESTFEEP